jgi:hypothetical protein
VGIGFGFGEGSRPRHQEAIERLAARIPGPQAQGLPVPTVVQLPALFGTEGRGRRQQGDEQSRIEAHNPKRPLFGQDHIDVGEALAQGRVAKL